MAKRDSRFEKKSEMIEVRISHAQKQAFIERCRDEGLSASEAIRMLMSGPLPSVRPRMVFNPERMKSMIIESTMSSGFIGAAALGAATALALMISAPSGAGDADAVFEAFDADRNGTVELHEFVDVVTRDGFVVASTAEDAPPRGLERDAAREFHRYDRDGNGRISRNEFSHRYMPVMAASFAALDVNSDNLISVDELTMNFVRAGIHSSGPQALETPAELGERYVRMMDRNDDLHIDMQEFLEIG